MKVLILYYSRYSTCKQYAIWISEQVNATIFDIEAFTPALIEDYSLVIIGSPVYRGVHKGERFVKKQKKLFKDKEVIFFDCGLTPYTSTTYKSHHMVGTLKEKDLSFIHKAYINTYRYFNKNCIYTGNLSIDKIHTTPLVKEIKQYQIKEKKYQ